MKITVTVDNTFRFNMVNFIKDAFYVVFDQGFQVSVAGCDTAAAWEPFGD